jgi:hypothetical protein
MSASVIGLVGVLLGAMLAGLWMLWLKRREERGELLGALRLVYKTMGGYRDDVGLPVDTGRLDPHKAILARHLDARSWRTVQRGLDALASGAEDRTPIDKAVETLANLEDQLLGGLRPPEAQRELKREPN